MLRIGIDFGGVLSIHDGGHVEHRNTAINIEGALEALQQLKAAGHQLYLVSFAGKNRALETQQVLQETCPNLFDKLIFVKNRMFKKHACAAYGLDVMVDDMADILENIHVGCPRLLPIWFQYRPNAFARQGAQPMPQEDERFITATNWQEIVTLITFMLKDEQVQPQHIDLNGKVYDI